jgi:hypothetical protein
LTEIEQFKEEEVEGVPVLRFPTSLRPPFIVDFCGIKQQLLQWVMLKKNDPNNITFCSINGMTKSGKSAALNHVLPPLVREHFPDALFFRLSFDTIVEDGTSFRSFMQNLLEDTYSWAKMHEIKLPAEPPSDASVAKLRRTLLDAFEAFENCGRTIFCLWDEIQRYLCSNS